MSEIEYLNANDLINWLNVLSNGYVKPDLSDNKNSTGIVRETKNYIPFIMAINARLCELSGIECPNVKDFTEFKKQDR